MGRVFWQFFIAIWLTILGAIGVIVVTNTFLKVLPPRADMLDFRERLALDATADLVRKGAVRSAMDYLEVTGSGRHPIKLTMRALDADIGEEACRPISERSMRVFDPGGRQCYQVDVLDEPPTLLQQYLPPFLPPLAAMFSSLVSAFLLARYLVRPIITVRTGLNALANGNFSYRISRLFGWWRDEITALGRDFNVTAAKLEEFQESQRRLFHDVSHEIRSPLFRMQAAFGLLQKNPGKLVVLMPRMQREIERINDLVEEILALARLGPTAAPLSQNQTLNVIDLVSAVIDAAAFEAEPRGIEISYAGTDSFTACVNGELVYRAIENVMRNAVKYSRENSTVSVDAVLAPDGNLRVTIANDGVFVAPKDVERMFEPFTRLSEDGAATQGHGLGLAIARRAIEKHGGRVWASSNLQGGVTVNTELPNGLSRPAGHRLS